MRRLLLMLSLLILGAAPAWGANSVLTWTANTEADLAGYKVYFGTNGACAATAPLPPLVIGGSAVQVGKVTTYTHTGTPAIDGVLCYEITAFDTSGNESPHSTRVNKTVNLVPPLAPIGLSVAVQ